MSPKKVPNTTMKMVKFTLNFWIYGKLKDFADENGMSVRAAIRFIINQFFKQNINLKKNE